MAAIHADRFWLAAVWRTDHVVVWLHGDLDLRCAAQLSRYLDQILNDGQPHVVLELQNVQFIDSSGFAAIEPAARRASTEGGGVTLRSVSPFLERVVKLTPLRELVELEVPQPA